MSYITFGHYAQDANDFEGFVFNGVDFVEATLTIKKGEHVSEETLLNGFLWEYPELVADLRPGPVVIRDQNGAIWPELVMGFEDNGTYVCGVGMPWIEKPEDGPMWSTIARIMK